MKDGNDIKEKADQIKEYIIEHNTRFIKNNERFRDKVNMNFRQVNEAIKYLRDKGFLKSWNDKVYQIVYNKKVN
jgi:hypothetical protein